MGFLNKIFGSKVKIPKLKEIDLDQELDKAFKSMQERLPEAQRISQDIGEADADTAMAVLERIAPGSQQMIQQRMQNIQEGLRGELPADVQRMVTDRAAARSFAGGFGGSQAGRNLELRDFGLTSLQRIDTAMGQSAQALAQFSSMAPRQSVSSMFLTPGQRLSHAVGERNMQYQRDLAVAREKLKDPVTAAVAGAVAKIGGSALGALVGGPAGAAAGLGKMGAPSGGFGGGIVSGSNAASTMGSSAQGSGSGFWRNFAGNLGTSLMR